jgi:hypothetical protein
MPLVRLSRLSPHARRRLLLVMTALVVCYVRHLVQYGRRPWAAGLGLFLASWFVHYLAVLLVCGLVLVMSLKSDPFFLPGRPERTMDERMDDTTVHVCITLFVAAVLVWFVYFWPGSGDSYD